MADSIRSITDLPLDILLLIFPYLDAPSFLSFCATCKAFQQPSIRLDPAYWSYATRSTFRVPNQPVVQHDGAHWQKMYRRLLTQSRVYTWGNNTHHRLGQWHADEEIRQPRNPRFGRAIPSAFCPYPAEMERIRELGVIADLQCGGWSTTILTSRGSLHTAGVLDGETNLYTPPGTNRLQPLRFPAGYADPTTATHAEPATSIRQFSAGRSHILGLSDSGKIWSWSSAQSPALQVKLTSIDVKEDIVDEAAAESQSLYGQVKQVVAGWTCSSAYVYGTGIVGWVPVYRNGDDQAADAVPLQSFEVPNTGFQRTKNVPKELEQDNTLGEDVGVVMNYILLENFVVFVTDMGKVFCASLVGRNKVKAILELRALRGARGTAMDVQGSFRRFAVFKNGEVITVNQDYLDDCWAARDTDPQQINIQGGLQKIPALQHNDVISIAFGDYHFLALHSTGKITTYGTELQSCGALGLGFADGVAEGRLRGMSYQDLSHNVSLVPHAYTQGRAVWFRSQQHKWLRFLSVGGADRDEAMARIDMFTSNRAVQGEVSEWIEQEGRQWDKDKGEDGLGAFYALRVSAAGWHSGAVVLVNDELASKAGEYDWAQKSFPRLKLNNGEEMPGTIPFDEWREGRPEWDLNVQV